MKKIFLILFLAFSVACSKEENPAPPEKEIEPTKYFLRFNQDCLLGIEGASKFQVEEEIFNSIVNNTKLGDCDSYFTVRDIEGNLHEGYYVGHGTEGPTE